MAMDLNRYSYRIFTTQQRDERHAARWVVAAAWQAVVAVLRWVADLPWDSRERLRSQEQELAMLGITWASDPVHDAALAREIEIARQRRREVDALAPAAERPFVRAHPCEPSAVTVGS
jgi:hypothetical protein